MADVITVIILVVVIGAAVAYIIKAKKSGVKCIGCPSSGMCSGHCTGNCSGGESACNCGCQTDTKEK